MKLMQMGNKTILPSSLCSQLSFLPIFILPPFSPFMAMLKPCPSAPSRLPTGTTQSSKITARVGWEFQPTWEKTEHFPDCLRSSTPPAPSRELPSLLSTPLSHCQAATERLWSMWFGLSVPSLETGTHVFGKRHRSNEMLLRLKSFTYQRDAYWGNLTEAGLGLEKIHQAGTPVPSKKRSLMLCTELISVLHFPQAHSKQKTSLLPSSLSCQS